ncbi:MAG: oxidoreductase [Waddliaceae bacterium]|nr:oxidoreductase [Waddliaceae bacterium]
MSMERLIRDLKNHLEGDVYSDQISRQIYSVDASIYQIEPLVIVLPKTKDDIITTSIIAKKHQVPLIGRGAGTGLAGGCIGKGIILDCSKYLNKILEINFEKGYALCEPGVVQDQLNQALAPHGYRLGPDTSTGNRATIGGMVGNNSSGAHSLRYGRTSEHCKSVEMVLYGGDVLSFSSLGPKGWEKKCQDPYVEGDIYRNLSRIRDKYAEEIRTRFPKLRRRASGYNLDELLREKDINLARLIAGSEGTLGIITEAKLKISHKPAYTGICVLEFKDRIEPFRYTEYFLDFQPFALEVIDEQPIQLAQLAPSMKGQMNWLKGNPSSLVIVELDAESKEELVEKVEHFTNEVSKREIGYAQTALTNSKDISQVWAFRKAGLGLIMSRRTQSRAIAFVEDIAVAPTQLESFMTQFLQYLNKQKKEAGFYGHMGEGCVHVRPYMDMRDPKDIELIKTIMLDVADIVLAHDGVLSGEHGDGLIRSWTHPKMFGERLYTCFQEIKATFDPEGQMNPGKLVDSPPVTENLRDTPDTKVWEPQTFLDFSEEGGLEFASGMCNGNGQCRQRSNLMCPSFQAFGNERHSTRARTQALRSIFQGKLDAKSFSSQELHEVLDYCLECKGCKKECPSQVDMAKMKSEFLYHYQKEHGISLRTRLFAYVDQFSRLASLTPSLSNWASSSLPAKWLLKKIGIPSKRQLPPFAQKRFSQHRKTQKHSQKKLVLLIDTFTEFNYPEIGLDAMNIFHAMGYEVLLPQYQCCGRPAISKGLLPYAKKKASKLVETLLPYAKQGLPIVGLEPSCILTLRDEYKALLPSEDTRLVASMCFSLDEFLDQHREDTFSHIKWKNDQSYRVRIHGHCHQKALVGMDPSLRVLKSIPGFQVKEIPSGCCGMAGSFGYEEEHYKMSIAIAKQRLVPGIQKCSENTLIIASGLSCRSQIEHTTKREALHLAEAIARQIDETAKT